MDSKVFILEKEHEHDYVLDIGDVVRLDDYSGIVEKKEYDTLNDTMHYFTDIVVETDYNEQGNRNKINEIKEDYLPRLKNILTTYDAMEKKEKRGFWSELFNL